MYCKKCGLPLDKGTKFCPSCGEPTEEIEVKIEEPQFEERTENKSFEDKAKDSFHRFNDTEDRTGDFDPRDIEDNKVISLFSYLGILFLIPLLAAKNSKYARFHVNQGIVLFIFDIVFGAIGGMCVGLLALIPVVGAIIGGLVSTGVSVLILVFVILGICNALTGKAKRLPLIGKFDLLS